MLPVLPTKHNVKTVTDMREDAVGLLKHVKKHGFAYLFYQSQPEGVLLSQEKYQEILDRIDDLQESIEAIQLHREALNTPDEELIPFEVLEEKYL